MSTPRLIVAVVLALVGLVWIAQGTNLIAGSAMSGSGFWAVMGVVLIVVAGAVAWSGRSSGSNVTGGDRHA